MRKIFFFIGEQSEAIRVALLLVIVRSFSVQTIITLCSSLRVTMLFTAITAFLIYSVQCNHIFQHNSSTNAGRRSAVSELFSKYNIIVKI